MFKTGSINNLMKFKTDALVSTKNGTFIAFCSTYSFMKLRGFQGGADQLSVEIAMFSRYYKAAILFSVCA